MAKKKAKRASEQKQETLTFEDALERLEKSVAALEDGELGLDESLAEYEKGIKYLKLCYRQLSRAERKIEVLSGMDDQGEPEREPYEEGEMSLEEKQAARGRRRSQRTAERPGEDVGMDDEESLF